MCSDVEQFLDVTRTNPALRLKIVSELRERSHVSSHSLIGMAALGLSVLAIFSSILASLEVLDALKLIVVYGIGGALILLIAFPLAIYNDTRSRHASSWLAAYLDGEAQERVAVDPVERALRPAV